MSSPQNILISGVSGFVGSNLAPFLAPHYHLKGISRSQGSNLIKYSELTEGIMGEADAFIHLAGKAHDLKKTSSEEEYFQVNTELTKDLFDLFLKSDCNTFIYMSSVKAVADTVNDVLSEEAVPNPITAYGRSKLEAENYLLSKQLPPAKKLYILRPAMIHGPNNKGNLNLLFQVVKKGIPYPLGAFENKRSFVTVDNLCFIIAQLLERRPPSGVYHIADDTALSTKDLVELIGEACGRKAKTYDVPKPFILALAKAGDLLKLPFNTERLHKLTENYVVSNSKIKEALAESLPYDSIAGLKKTFNSFEK